MSVEGSTFNRNSNTSPTMAPLRPIRPTERALESTSQCSSSDLGGFGVDSTSESSKKNGRSSSEQVSVALPQQLSKAMVSLLASLSARDLSTGLSSHRAGMMIPSLTAVSHSFAISDRFRWTIVHVPDHLSGSFLPVEWSIPHSECRHRWTSFRVRSSKGDRSRRSDPTYRVVRSSAGRS